jgi:hypothetical protein
MKVYMSAKRVILTYLLLGLIALVAFYSTVGFVWPPTDAHYFVIGVWFLSTAFFLFLSLKKSYYILDGRRLVHHQINREYVYDCNDILYVDEAYSIKHKTLCFYTNTGVVRYLPYDRQGLIFEHVMKMANNLLSREEYKARFPNTRL